MAEGYMAQTRPSPTLSRGFTRLDRFLAPYGVIGGHEQLLSVHHRRIRGSRVVAVVDIETFAGDLVPGPGK